MFALTRNNRRKTTKARYTQVIDVPKFIIKEGLSKDKIKEAKEIPVKYRRSFPDLFKPNESAFAGRRKFIFHARPTVK